MKYLFIPSKYPAFIGCVFPGGFTGRCLFSLFLNNARRTAGSRWQEQVKIKGQTWLIHSFKQFFTF